MFDYFDTTMSDFLKIHNIESYNKLSGVAIYEVPEEGIIIRNTYSRVDDKLYISEIRFLNEESREKYRDEIAKQCELHNLNMEDAESVFDEDEDDSEVVPTCGFVCSIRQ